MNLTDYNEIQALLQRHGFRFSKSLGQNFLVRSWVPAAIADAADLTGDDVVYEVGPGIGCLTVELAKRAGRVVSLELDKALMPVLSETLAGCENVEVVFCDALKTRFEEPGKFVANLPYNVTSPLLTKVIDSDMFDSITVMIQREVAKRICAGPGEEDYSSFGIFVQWHYEPQILFDVSPDCFIPQPKVTSSVISMRRRIAPICEVKDEKLMFSIIRAAFNMRRKTLVNAVSSNLHLDKEKFSALLENLGYDSRVRGEVLSIRDFARISDEIAKKDGDIA